MTLTDASPLVALIDARQALHATCVRALPRLSSPLITTWPCFTESMYLLHQLGGWTFQHALWVYFETNQLQFYSLSEIDLGRMRFLMDKYHDTPMDLADASLVAAAESLNSDRIFTLDSDFYIYRFRDTGSFEVIPPRI